MESREQKSFRRRIYMGDEVQTVIGTDDFGCLCVKITESFSSLAYQARTKLRLRRRCRYQSPQPWREDVCLIEMVHGERGDQTLLIGKMDQIRRAKSRNVSVIY